MSSCADSMEYADISQQCVQFQSSAVDDYSELPCDESRAAEGNYEERSPENLYPAYEIPETEVMTVEGVVITDVEHSLAMKTNNTLWESLNSQQSISKSPNKKKSITVPGMNGLCPPTPVLSSEAVDHSTAEDLEEIFPKTCNYQVAANARNSVMYLSSSKWEREREFLSEKRDYWRSIEQNGALPEKDHPRLGQLIKQLTWLVDHCWSGRSSDNPLPEMLWRARKEEMRRLEQLLVRKQVNTNPVLAARVTRPVESSTRHDSHTKEDYFPNTKGDENKKQSREQQSSSKKISSMSVSREKKDRGDTSKKSCPSQSSSLDPKTFEVQEQSRASCLFMLLVHLRRWEEALRKLRSDCGRSTRAHCKQIEEHIKELTAEIRSTKASLKCEEPSFSEIESASCSVPPESSSVAERVKNAPASCFHALMNRSASLKNELRDAGFETVYDSWVLFLPEVTSKAKKRSASAKAAAKKQPKDVSASSALPHFEKVGALSESPLDSSSTSAQKKLLKVETSSSDRIIAQIKTSGKDRYGEGENRLELEDIIAIEDRWCKFASSANQEIAAVSRELSLMCRSYRSLLKRALPKSLADYRHADKKRRIDEFIAKLKFLTRKTNTPIRREDSEKTAAVKRVFEVSPDSGRASSMDTNSATPPGCLENDNAVGTQPSAKRRKLTERTDNVEEHNQNAPESINTESNILSRPKRHTKPPHRFLYDYEMNDEAEKRKRNSRSPGMTSPPVKASPAKHNDEQFSRDNTQFEQQNKNKNAAVCETEPHTDEFFFIANEDEEEDEYDDEDESRIKANDEIVFDEDVVDVEPRHEFRCDSAGVLHDTYRYMACFCNGIEEEVTKRAYEMWKEHRAKGEKRNDITVATEDQEENKDENEEDDVASNSSVQDDQMDQSSFQDEDGGKVGAGLPVKVALTPQNDVQRENRTTDDAAQEETSIVAINNSDKTLEQGDATNGHSHPSVHSNSPGSAQEERTNSLFQVDVRNGSLLSGTVKNPDLKLRTQYDYLLMINENDHLEKLGSLWNSIPEGGDFDDKLADVRKAIKDSRSALCSRTSTWDEYFTLKKNVQKLINEVLVEFSLIRTGVTELRIPPLVSALVPPEKDVLEKKTSQEHQLSRRKSI